MGPAQRRPKGRWCASARRFTGPTLQSGNVVTKIAVVGGGAWGTALADLLARKGGVDAVTLWAREPEVVESVNREHLNHMFLPGAALAPGVTAEANLVAAVRGADVVVSAAPSHAVRDVMTRTRGQVGRGALIVSVSKGLEPERLSTPSCVLADVLPKDTPIAVLSGPSFAREVYARQPTAGVAAAREHAVAQRAQQLGVELGEGKSLEDALAGRAAVVEGVNTARSAVTLAERHGVELPIAREVAEVLFHRKSPGQAVADLMERELKPEHWR